MLLSEHADHSLFHKGITLPQHEHCPFTLRKQCCNHTKTSLFTIPMSSPSFPASISCEHQHHYQLPHGCNVNSAVSFVHGYHHQLILPHMAVTSALLCSVYIFIITNRPTQIQKYWHCCLLCKSASLTTDHTTAVLSTAVCHVIIIHWFSHTGQQCECCCMLCSSVSSPNDLHQILCQLQHNAWCPTIDSVTHGLAFMLHLLWMLFSKLHFFITPNIQIWNIYQYSQCQKSPSAIVLISLHNPQILHPFLHNPYICHSMLCTLSHTCHSIFQLDPPNL